MSKRPFVIFGILAVCLAVLIPLWAYLADADEEKLTGGLSASQEEGRSLFATNCGTCHVLSAAGTDGNFGPNLDSLLSPTGPAPDEQTAKGIQGRVLVAIKEGVDSSTPGRMPGQILTGEQADQVAEFVAQQAGK
jgi:mono/diheme cytochrome c family protein